MMEESELVERSIQGDEEAFSLLFRKYQVKIHRLCMKLVNDENIAQDLTQETFLRAFKKLHTFKKNSQFYTWLYRIGYNLAISYLRKKKQLKEVEFQEYKIEKVETTEENINYDHLKSVLAMLPEKQRIVFEMYVLKKIPEKEIAALLDIPHGTVRSRLYYARKKLQELV